MTDREEDFSFVCVALIVSADDNRYSTLFLHYFMCFMALHLCDPVITLAPSSTGSSVRHKLSSLCDTNDGVRGTSIPQKLPLPPHHKQIKHTFFTNHRYLLILEVKSEQYLSHHHTNKLLFSNYRESKIKQFYFSSF